MRLCDEREDGNAADEQTAESAASRRSRDSERLNVPRFSRHDDKQISRLEFPTAVYLLMKQNQSPQELIDFSFKLEPSVTKLVCVRTSSKGISSDF